MAPSVLEVSLPFQSPIITPLKVLLSCFLPAAIFAARMAFLALSIVNSPFHLLIIDDGYLF
jgi:hypothetical protein